VATITLDYGTTGLPLDLAGLNARVMRPTFVNGLADEAAGFREAVRQPMGGPPIRDVVRANERVAVVIPDITRALPNERLLTWLFEELSHVPAANFVIISGTGSHRRNTDDEWVRMVGRRIFERYRCIDHDGHDPATSVSVGTTRFGYDVPMNREYVEADRRVLMGFIEPHFMAGFSGGYKAVFPGVTGVEAIMHYHNAANIGHPKSTWGVVEGNPTQEHVRAGGALLPVDLLVNVTLNAKRQITAFFCGDPIAAHDAGCAYCKKTAMQACDEPFPIVVTTNSGYPLDQNLYQTVKGMSAAAEIVAPGGLVIAAARCNDGFPEHGNFRQFLHDHASVDEMLTKINEPGFRMFDQWQVQKLADILRRCRVALRSEIDDEAVRRAYLLPVDNVRAAIDAELGRVGQDAAVAVLPEGPLTIPYLSA
jgi:nickel-dependent lactate racemase